MSVLVVNAGSSTVKLRRVEDDDTVSHAEDLDADTGATGEGELESALGRLCASEGIDAVGHRIVHGGTEFTRPVRVDDDVRSRIEALGALAPLHQPPAVAALRAVEDALPGVPQVACFDTMFHTSMSDAARAYAVPARWRDEYGIRRYGFHGMAHEWASRRAAEIVGRDVTDLRVVVAHLGSGASVCAVDRGRSVDTTMGFTPTSGLVMATRSGDLDPSAVSWLVAHAGLAPADVDDALDHGSGLVGLCGRSDMRAVVAAAEAGDDDAGLALDVFVHRARSEVAAMAAATEGLDVLAFSGGIGENAPTVRERIVGGLGFLGLGVDGDANAAAGGDADLTASGSAARTVVVTSREEVLIAREVRALLGSPPDRGDRAGRSTPR